MVHPSLVEEVEGAMVCLWHSSLQYRPSHPPCPSSPSDALRVSLQVWVPLQWVSWVQPQSDSSEPPVLRVQYRHPLRVHLPRGISPLSWQPPPYRQRPSPGHPRPHRCPLHQSAPISPFPHAPSRPRHPDAASPTCQSPALSQRGILGGTSWGIPLHQGSCPRGST